jgi:hypothetical protein
LKDYPASRTPSQNSRQATEQEKLFPSEKKWKQIKKASKILRNRFLIKRKLKGR